MAIVKMKKLRLMVIRAEKDRLLQDLERFGCVEFAVMDDRPKKTAARAARSILTL